MNALPVFPGAVGFGTDTPAGRGGVVVRVTRLDDVAEYDDSTAPPGTLRDALENDAYGYPRVVVFDVSGIIDLKKKIRIRDRFITVAGQTAPAPGIIVRGEGIEVAAGDVLLQHVSVWTGNEIHDPTPPVCVNGKGGPLDSRGAFDVAVSATSGTSKVVFDHVSGGWTTDQIVGVWSDSSTELIENVTYSNSLLAEALRFAGHCKGEHSSGLLFGRYTKGMSMIRNISAFNVTRHPLARDRMTDMQVVNNFVYWPRHDEKSNFYADEEDSPWPLVATARGNVYFLHPSNNTSQNGYGIVAQAQTGFTLQLFVEDNLVYNHDGSGEVGTGNPWSVVKFQHQGGTITQLATESAQFPDFPITKANRLEPLLLANAGARPAFRSPVDQRILDDIRTRARRDAEPNFSNGYLDHPNDVGGWPNWPQVTVPFQVPADPNGDVDGDGYKNLEEHLHHLAFSLEGDPRVEKLDSFEDGNANGWFMDGNPSDWTVVTDGSSKALQQASTAAEAQGYLVGTYFYEQTVQAKVKPTAFDGADRFVRIYARYRDPLHAYYLTMRSTGLVELKRLDGSVIPLTSAPLPVNIGDWYSMRLSVEGGVLAASVTNLTTQQSVMLNHTDTNPLPPGYAAVGTFHASARFDDVLASPDADAESLDPAVQQTDDFEDGNDEGWTDAGTNEAWSVVLDGANHVYRQDDMQSGARAVLSGTNWTDQVIEADVKPIAFNGANRFFGLYARFTDIGNSYYFVMRSNNTIELKKIVGNVTQPALDSDTLPFTVTPGTSYRLKLEAIGTSLKAYLNGALVLQATDSTFASGRATLGTFMTRADFDNVVVSPTAGTLVFSDDFEDGDAAGWTPGGASAWSVVTDGSQVYRQTDTTHDAWSYAGSPLADQIVSARAKALAFSEPDRWFGIAARVVDPSNYYYITVRSSGLVELKKLVGGTVFPLDSAPFTFALNTWYDLRLEAIGDSIKGYVNGQPLLEATDTTHASGTFGARMFRASAAYDDFSVTEP